LTLKNKKIGLSLNIDDKLLTEIVEAGRKYYPNEFGGFLIGNYSEDFKELNITDTILPNKHKASRYLFERDAARIDHKLKQFYLETPKKYYVGEWHTHPNNLPIPSNTDSNAMVSIANHDKVSINNPALLIIGYNTVKVDYGFYVLFKNKLYKYE
jgi:integrative and conjugative element protein (TIGR02256 family)